MQDELGHATHATAAEAAAMTRVWLSCLLGTGFRWPTGTLSRRPADTVNFRIGVGDAKLIASLCDQRH